MKREKVIIIHSFTKRNLIIDISYKTYLQEKEKYYEYEEHRKKCNYGFYTGI